VAHDTTAETPPRRVLPMESASLVREMARAYVSEVEFYREQMGLAPAEAAARAREPAGQEERQRVLNAPADQIGWRALSTFAEHDPETAGTAWSRILAEAEKAFVTGHRAGQAMECNGTPWGRARFLVVREAFFAEWQPKGGIELALIDTLAQAYTGYSTWLNLLQAQSMSEGQEEDSKLKRDGYWQPPRLTTAAAMDQSAAMVDRFNRLFLRTLRSLRDLRRYASSVVVQNAGQVNVGAQQLNVAAD
jgi:hypothetical protein